MNASALRPHRGTLILVLGILSILCTCLPLGIVAWVLGHQEIRDIDAGLADPAGRGTAAAGRVLGIISVLLTALGMLVGACLLALGIVTLPDALRGY